MREVYEETNTQLDNDTEVQALKSRITFLESLIEDTTFDSFYKIIGYYENLLNMDIQERGSELYGLMSTYGLLLLNSTYDISIKEIFRSIFKISLSDKPDIEGYLSNIIDKKILNQYMTNIKHETVKNTFAVSLDIHDARLQQSTNTINDLIKTRNTIAHGLETASKGHNDLYEALDSVIIYLEWYSNQLKLKFEA